MSTTAVRPKCWKCGLEIVGDYCVVGGVSGMAHPSCVEAAPMTAPAPSDMKSCPCCGSNEAISHREHAVSLNSFTTGEYCSVGCDICGTQTGQFATRELAAAAWNRRASDIDGPAGQTHHHLKSGHLVREIGRGFAQVSVHPIEEMSAVVIYEHAGKLWVRNAVEFDDGRFEKLDKPFVALGADGPAGWAGDLIERLVVAEVAGCTCHIKTPDIAFHAKDCHYRLFREAWTEIERLNKWADGFSDAQLKERRLAEERIAELAAHLAALQQERDETLEELGKVILACPMRPTMRMHPPSQGVRNLRTAFEASEALASSLQRRVEELTGALQWAREELVTWHDAKAVLAVVDAALTPPEQGGKP